MNVQPRSRRAERTIDRILEGAIRATARHGLRRVSITDVCLEAGVSRGTLYRYIDSKATLVDAIGRHVVDSLRRDLQEVTPPGVPFATAAREVVRLFFAYPDRRPATARMIEQESEFAWQVLRDSHADLRSVVAAALFSGTSVDPPREADTVVSEVVLRIGIQGLLMPPQADADSGDRIAEWVACLHDTLTSSTH